MAETARNRNRIFKNFVAQAHPLFAGSKSSFWQLYGRRSICGVIARGKFDSDAVEQQDKNLIENETHEEIPD
jgi:hypothetical protein